MTRFCTLLVEERNKRKLKQCQVAELFNWCSDYYCKIEKGYLWPPKTRLNDFAKYLSLSIDELVVILKQDEMEIQNVKSIY